MTNQSNPPIKFHGTVHLPAVEKYVDKSLYTA